MSRPLLTLVTEADQDGAEHDRVMVGTKAYGASFETEVWPVDAPEVIAAVNRAHAAVVEPLHARLAVAREALDKLDARVVGLVPHDDPAVLAAVNALAAIDAEAPPEMVPLARYQQLEQVLADALEFTEAKKWRERCERALLLLRMSGVRATTRVEDAVDVLEGRATKGQRALEGRDEPGPAKVPEYLPRSAMPTVEEVFDDWHATRPANTRDPDEP